MDNATKLRNLISKAGKLPCTFNAIIQFRGYSDTEKVRICHCSQEQYKKLKANPRFDSNIFYYIHSVAELQELEAGAGEFKLIQITDY